MPNCFEHMLVSGLISAVRYSQIMKEAGKEIDLTKVIGIGLLGAIAGILPDVLEPATNPNHRSICHSILAGAGVIALDSKINKDLDTEQKAMQSALFWAYGTHLILDAFTPKSLPVV